uniref:MFS transporter n=1 Tax=Prevotella sp. TaxID=59823 RepID=UPI003FEEB570
MSMDCNNETPTMLKEKPDMSFGGLWNLSFGFFGVQIAYALQSANISRIFATLGADPHNLSYFWILPPLMGILVQPIVGTCSDKTWCRFGRRIPYLFVGAAIAVLVMCLLPNSGSFGMTVSTAMVFGLIALMFLDTSINMAMQPFKMLVGDMVNEKQKGLAYSIQSFLCNAGSLVGYVFPFVFAALGIANTAAKGTIPDSVIYSFYVGAAILILCVIYTVWKVKEWNPHDYNEYNGSLKSVEEKEEGSGNWFVLLRNAPSTFWKVGLVQFFCWFAFMYMWTYTNGTVAANCWGTTDVTSEGYQAAGNWVGILFAVQAIGSVVWAVVLPKFKNRKMAYSLSLVLGGVGFVACAFIHDQYVLFVPFLLIGCAWAAMLAMPFTFVTNALQGYGPMGASLGLLSGTICVP